jgi:hypothetical protein
MREIQDKLKTSLINAPRASVKADRSINSYYVALEDINTAEYLCENFDTEKALVNIIPYFGYGDVESEYQL